MNLPPPEIFHRTLQLTQALLRAVENEPESSVTLSALLSAYINVSNASGRSTETAVANLNRFAAAIESAEQTSASNASGSSHLH